MVDNGKALLNTVILPVPLAKNVTINKNSNISVYLYKETRRLLADIIMLTIEDIEIDPSGQAVKIKSNVPNVADISSYTLKVDFASGILISQDGKPYDSTTNTFSMS